LIQKNRRGRGEPAGLRPGGDPRPGEPREALNAQGSPSLRDGAIVYGRDSADAIRAYQIDAYRF
jgi:hypothetical protein